LHFEKREEKRRKNLAGPKIREKREEQLPSLIPACHVIIISEFLRRELLHYHYPKEKARL